jgi:hypothetical protein
MTGKVFTLVGLFLQLGSVGPSAYLAFRTTRDKYVDESGKSCEVGTDISSVTRADKEERMWLFASFALIALGAVLQILGVCSRSWQLR